MHTVTILPDNSVQYTADPSVAIPLLHFLPEDTLVDFKGRTITWGEYKCSLRMTDTPFITAHIRDNVLTAREVPTAWARY